MIAKGRIECPICHRPFKVWFQAGVRTVPCPTCWSEVDTADVQLEPPRPQSAWRSRHLASTLGLIWHRLVGYNEGRPDGLTL